MPSINDLVDLKPIQSNFNSDVEFSRLLDLWEDHIAPLIVELEQMAGTRPQPSSFEDNEDFEEAFGFWMGRQGGGIAMRLSHALRRWQTLSRSDDG